MADGAKKINMHNRAKFCSDWSNRYRDIAVFEFSRWRPSTIVD